MSAKEIITMFNKGGNVNLKALIYSKGLTQWDVCRKIGWNESRLSRVVTGRQCPSDEDLATIFDVLDAIAPEKCRDPKMELGAVK